MKLKVGKWYHFFLYDHCQYDNTETDSMERTGNVVVDFVGKLEHQDTSYYHIRIINCNEKGNSLFWKVMKKTLTEQTKEVEV